jgi:hypothetical protein
MFAIEHKQQVKTGLVKAIAPVFDHTTFGRHQPLMAIRRDQLFFAEGTVTLPLSSKAVTDAPIATAELFLWDLSALNVSFDVGRQDATLQAQTGEHLVSIEFLESLRRKSASLSGLAMVGDGRGLANAVINLSSGVGKASAVPTHEPGALPEKLHFNFVTNKDAKDDKPDDPIKGGFTGQPVDMVLTDVVEFVVDIGNADRLTLVFASATGYEVGVVTVKPETMVTFSHLCPSMPPKERKYDLEFAQYYNLLVPADRELAISEDQAVPKPFSSRSSEGADCDVQAQLDYEA